MKNYLFQAIDRSILETILQKDTLETILQKDCGDSLVVALSLWPLKFQGIEDSITTEHGERYSKH